MNKYRINLKKTSRNSLSCIADKLYEFKIICGTTQKNPEFDDIIESFIDCLDIYSTKINLLEACEQFLTGFSCDNGLPEKISNLIRKDWEESIFEEGDKWPLV